jgi:hypothetical protein
MPEARMLEHDPRGLAHLYVLCKGGDGEVGGHSFSLQVRVSLLCVQPSPALLRHQ